MEIYSTFGILCFYDIVSFTKKPFCKVQWISVNRDSDKGDFQLIGIDWKTIYYITLNKIIRIIWIFG